jgi:TRAP-type transport system periplasmic protein
MKRLAVGLGILACMLVSQTTKAEPVKLRFAFFLQNSEMAWVTTVKPFIDAVNDAGKGVIEIEPYPNGALGRNATAQAQMIIDGVADIAWVAPGYTPNRFPDDEALELPGLFRDLRESTEVETRLLQDGKLRGYDKQFYPLFALGTTPFTIYSRAPIRQLSDLKGLKIRSNNPIMADTLRALGAVPLLLPLNEAVEGLGRGTVDGTLLFPPLLFDLGINRVTSWDYELKLGASPNAILMNRAKFESLPADAKAILEKFSGKWLLDKYFKDYVAYADGLEARLNADKSRHRVTPTAADQAKAEASWQPVIDAWVAKDPGNAALVADIHKLIDEVRAGQNIVRDAGNN